MRAFSDPLLVQSLLWTYTMKAIKMSSWMKCGYFSKITTEYMTVFHVGLHKHWQLKSHEELKRSYFYWTLLQTFINPFLCVLVIDYREKCGLSMFNTECAFLLLTLRERKLLHSSRWSFQSIFLLSYSPLPSLWRCSVGLSSSLSGIRSLSLANEGSWGFKVLLN